MENNDFRVKQVNITFLATVLVAVFAGDLTYGFCYLVNMIFKGVGASIYDALLGNDFGRLLYSQLALFLPTLVYILCNREYFFSTLRIRRLRLKTYILVVVFGVFFIPVIQFVNSFSLLFTENTIEKTVNNVLGSHSLLSSIIVVALIPCVLEETMYRGVIYNEYSRINVVKALILSSLMFGLLHMNLNQFMYAVVGGVVFSLMVEATGSITASAVMHFMINGFSTVVTYFSSEIIEKSKQTSDVANDLNSISSTQEFEGALEFMNHLTAIQQVVVSLAMIAFICIIIDIVIFTQILISEGRKDYFKNLFEKKGVVINDEQEANIEVGEKNKLITPPLVIAIIIPVIVIILKR